MNIVNFLSLIWALFTWKILQLVNLPEDRLLVFRAKKKEKKNKNSISDELLKSIKQLNQDSVLSVKLKNALSHNSISKPEKIN
jgi:hypothetical protein